MYKRQGKIDAIRAYCETDVVNTYLVYLRFQLMRGVFDEKRYQKECKLVRSTLQQSSAGHWHEFLTAWAD